MKKLEEKNFTIITSGSVDGICTTAAVMRMLQTRGDNNIQILFARSFSVNRIELSYLNPKSKVILVDLAVNKYDKKMTENFLIMLQDFGHTLEAVIDKHSALDWHNVLVDAGIDPNILSVKPLIENDSLRKSTGEILLDFLGDSADSYLQDLCKVTSSSIRTNASLKMAEMVNQAVKSRIDDDVRRKYLAYHLSAGNVCADDMIAVWMSEYDEILFVHDKLIKNATCITKGVVRVDASNELIDMNVLIASLHKSGSRIVIVHSEIFNPLRGYKFPKITISTSDKNLDLLSIIGSNVTLISGLRDKVIIDPEFEHCALELILDVLVEA